MFEFEIVSLNPFRTLRNYVVDSSAKLHTRFLALKSQQLNTSNQGLVRNLSFRISCWQFIPDRPGFPFPGCSKNDLSQKESELVDWAIKRMGVHLLKDSLDELIRCLMEHEIRTLDLLLSFEINELQDIVPKIGLRKALCTAIQDHKREAQVCGASKVCIVHMALP